MEDNTDMIGLNMKQNGKTIIKMVLEDYWNSDGDAYKGMLKDDNGREKEYIYPFVSDNSPDEKNLYIKLKKF